MRKVWIYFVLVALFVLYSYVLVDPNFTPVSIGLWSVFRNFMVQIGYYQRAFSFMLYAVLVLLLFIYQAYLLRQEKISAFKIACGVGVLSLFAFSFLSHDLFNYLFDAKIVTHYHQNPYVYPAWSFVNDPDLRFMHWVQRTYPYGPTFLLLTIIPSFLSFGKFILSLLFFKILWAGMYICSVFVLEKNSKKAALFFATSPLIIVEGLINNHNDFIAVALAIWALYFINKKGKSFLSYGLFLVSIGIKYTSFPFVVLLTKWKYRVALATLGFAATLWYSYTHVGIQPWYFLNLWILTPFIVPYFLELTILSFFLLYSYYPYIALGGWDTQDEVFLKERIIAIGVVIALVLLTRKIIPMINSKQPAIKKRSS